MQYPFTGIEINEANIPDTTSTCMTNRCPDTLFPYSLSKASVAKRTPRPVAASLPRDPPRSYIEKNKVQLFFKHDFIKSLQWPMK